MNNTHQKKGKNAAKNTKICGQTFYEELKSTRAPCMKPQKYERYSVINTTQHTHTEARTHTTKRKKSRDLTVKCFLTFLKPG